MALVVSAEMKIESMRKASYHFNTKGSWVAYRYGCIEVVSVDWWVEEFQTSYVEGSLLIHEI